MMISSVFLISLIFTLYSSSVVTNAGIYDLIPTENATAAATETTPTTTTTVKKDDFNTVNYFTSLQHNFETITNALNRVDGAVQSLHEKAHNWEIFRHHINSWNEQMKTLEHKMDLMKRTQDDHQLFGNKLISLEFTLNHILSKVIYLSDSCNTAMGGGVDFDMENVKNKNHKLTNEHMELLRDIQRTLNADTNFKNEISTRLNSIERQVRNTYNISNRSTFNAPSTATASSPPSPSSALNNSKMAKIMVSPTTGGCNKYPNNFDQSLKVLERKLSLLLSSTSLPQRDFKQMFSLAKKNGKSIESILEFVTNTDKNIMDLQNDQLNTLHQCQAIAGELATFTESSDLLLKRIEMIVRDVHGKMNKNELGKNDEDGKTNTSETEGEELEAEVDFDEGYENADREDDNNNNDNESNNHDEDNYNDEEKEETSSVKNTKVDNNNEETNSNIDDSHINEKIQEFFEPHLKSCHELDTQSHIDGIYRFVSPAPNEAGRDFNERFCAFATDGAAWTVIQNRGPYPIQENFNRSWSEYRNGFGNLFADFWFGLEFIHQIVYRDDYELRIEMEDFNKSRVWVEYSIFRLDTEHYNYNLLIGGYNGIVPDAMLYHNELDFSTYDRRNDKTLDACCSCAMSYGSGWWFDNCAEANLNGIYRNEPTGNRYSGIVWQLWHGDYSLKKTKIMIRPKNWTLSNYNHNSHNENHNEYNEDP